MEKAQVIKVRDTLKAGKNWPLIVYIDNLFKKIDESDVFQFTKWDDENEVLYSYSLADPRLETSPSNIGGCISVFAVGYSEIQAMEFAKLNINDLGTSIDSIGTISAEWKERIIQRFKAALDPNLVTLSRSDINKAMGIVNGYKALNDNDDYYAGRYTQAFKETRPMAEHNAYAEKVAAEKKAAEEANNKN